MGQHANMVKVTAASPGTGSVTVSTAVSGFRTFAQGYNSADATVAGVRIEDASDATIWEICENCAYTHSGTTLSRGTLKDSSTGSAVNFTGSVIVSVIATAAFGNNAALNHVAASPTSAGVTGVVGTLHLLNISGLTGARDFVLPTAAATGDRIGVFCTTDAPTTAANVLQIKSGATGDLINGTDHSNTIWSSLLIKGECLIFRCIDGSTVDWIVEYDGRIPMHGSAAGVQTVTSNGSYVTVDFSALTVKANVGNIIDSTNDRIYARRAANFLLITFLAYSASGNGKSAICQWRTSAPAAISGTAMGSQSVQAGTFSVSSGGVHNIASGDYVDTQIWQNDSTSESCTVSVYALEVL